MAKGVKAKVSSKGVKSIQLVDGQYYKARSKGNFLVLAGGADAAFKVIEWLPDTTEADKKNLVWMLEDAQRNNVLLEHRAPVLNKINIPKALCGKKPLYYLEASLSAKIDKKISAGYLIVGNCDPLIKEAIWSAEKDGPRLGQTAMKYGEDVYLKITTEGLNGSNLTIEIYHRIVGENKSVRDIVAECINGEVNLLIKNTFSWYDVMKYGPGKAELFIMVKSDAAEGYIKDSRGDDAHARFLRMEKKIISRVTSMPENVTVAKVGEQLPQPGRVDHCRFTQIQIQDGPDPVLLFDEGKMKFKDEKNKAFYLDEKLFYEFNKYNLKPEAKEVLNKMAAILMEMPYIPVELGSHTDRFGSDTFNRTLSENRAKTALEYLVSRNVNASRITSKGYGKTMLADKTADLSKEASSVNRRTTIRLRIFSHDAQSLIFETIQPGKTYEKQLPITIKGLRTIGVCNISSNPHNEKVIPYSETVPNNKKGQLTVQADMIKPYVYSPMDNKLIAFTYLFPHLRAPQSFFFFINSCAYFSDKEKPSLIVKAYSDIKWSFQFFLNLSDPLNIDWTNDTLLSPAKREELRKAAKKLGDSHYNETTGIDFGVKLSADWNKSEKIYKGHEEFTVKFNKEIKAFFKLISSVKEITRGITSGTGGGLRKTEFGSTNNTTIKILAPKFVIDIGWKLARGSKNGVKTAEIGTEYTIKVYTEPLIGVEVTVDLLQMAVALATTGNPMAINIFNMVRDWASNGYKSERAEVSFEMYIDLVLKGTISGGIKEIVVNTASDDLTGEANMVSKIGATLKAGINLKAKVMLIEGGPNKLDVHAGAELSASASIGITATHSVKYHTREGLYYRPGLDIDPCVGHVILMIDVGISYRKISKDWKPVNVDDKREFWDKIDIMEELETITGISANFTIIPRKSE